MLVEHVIRPVCLYSFAIYQKNNKDKPKQKFRFTSRMEPILHIFSVLEIK